MCRDFILFRSSPRHYSHTVHRIHTFTLQSLALSLGASTIPSCCWTWKTATRPFRRQVRHRDTNAIVMTVARVVSHASGSTIVRSCVHFVEGVQLLASFILAHDLFFWSVLYQGEVMCMCCGPCLMDDLLLCADKEAVLCAHRSTCLAHEFTCPRGPPSLLHVTDLGWFSLQVEASCFDLGQGRIIQAFISCEWDALERAPCCICDK